MHRRRFLASTASIAALTAVAGCTGGGDSSPSDAPADTDQPSDTPGTGTPGTGTPEPTPDPDPELSNPGFENDLRGWDAGQDLPEDPNEEGKKVPADYAPATNPSAEGSGSFYVYIDGSADDGTVWLQQPVDLAPHDTLSVEAYWGDEPSANTLSKVAAYAGPFPEGDGGLTESDFDTSQPVEDHEGWRPYEYSVDHDGPGLVAVGISVVWETGISRYLDNVQLE